MIIGFMRNFEKPNYMAYLTTKLCSYHGYELIYIRPKDVDMINNTVYGKILIDNKWVEIETDLPKMIDISLYCYKPRNKKIINYLHSKTFLTDNNKNRISKQSLQTKLKEDKRYSGLAIPSLKVEGDFTKVENFLDKYSKIVMKPLKGERGKGIYTLERSKRSYKLEYQKKEKVLSRKNFIKFFEESIKENDYILQKYISSRTLQGDPFDCRIHVEKNGEGKWASARNFIRIGIGQKVISNVNQGGGIADSKPFLKANFGSKWEGINQRLNKLAVTLPYRIEELRGTHIMSLGMDVGIDKDGNIYIFEINSAPTTAPLKAEVAMLRTDYYKYIIENKLS